METTNKFNLTGIFVEDPKSKGYTAFFAQFPNIIAEGDTQEDASQNLLRLLRVSFEHQKNSELQNNHASNYGKVITKSFEFAMA